MVFAKLVPKTENIEKEVLVINFQFTKFPIINYYIPLLFTGSVNYFSVIHIGDNHVQFKSLTIPCGTFLYLRIYFFLINLIRFCIHILRYSYLLIVYFDRDRALNKKYSKILSKVIKSPFLHRLNNMHKANFGF